MRKFDRQQWLVLLAFLLVLSFTGFFAVRTVQRAVYWRHHRDERIRPWMSIGYVARSYRVPPHILYESLGLTQRPDRRPIRAIARAQNRSVDDVISTLEQAIADARARDLQRERPPGPEGPP